MTVSMETTIYAVWGPTAEWGDGNGPLGYFCERSGAESFIEDEKRALVDMAYQIPEDERKHNPTAEEEKRFDASLEDTYEWARNENGWPYDFTGYWIEENPLAYYVQMNDDMPADSEDALMEYLNER